MIKIYWALGNYGTQFYFDGTTIFSFCFCIMDFPVGLAIVAQEGRVKVDGR